MYIDYTKFYKSKEKPELPYVSYRDQQKTEDKKKVDYTKFFKSF